MNNLNEILQLCDVSNLPDWVKQEIELKRWRDIMAEQKYIQDYLPNFLKAEKEAKEAKMDYDAWFEHKKRMAMRWFGYYKKCKDKQKKLRLINQYNHLAQQRGR